MRALMLSLMLPIMVALSSCAKPAPRILSYDGPEVTQIYVAKERRRMYLLNGRDVLASYDVDLGFAPEGHKTAEGDGRTPEGLYLIDRRNPRSAFHLSLGISYPNAADRAAAAAAGVNPGGDIFIHGTAKRDRGLPDWTAGCIAVSDAEMEQIFAMVPVGTPIYISR